VSRGHVSAILLSHGVCISVYVDQCYFIFLRSAAPLHQGGYIFVSVS